jgi:arabinogalactan endo-1,4-beta-galactosidase
MKRIPILLYIAMILLAGCTGTRQRSDKDVTPPDDKPSDVRPVKPGRPGKPDEGPAGPAGTPAASKPDFWLGADISWATGMEKRGEMLYGFEGNSPVECSALMKDLGLNALRFRVWVDPAGGECDKDDLLEKCLRAKKQGMAVMVDFHYSDYWADPQHQPVPKSWKGHSYGEMLGDLRAHTVEVLQLLKDNGIEPEWVQIGNETTYGLLWELKPGRAAMGSTEREYADTVGHIDFAPAQYAGFIRAGHEAAKSVFPNTKTIVHLDDGWNYAVYEKNLGVLEEYDVPYDMVGMSLYPYWAREKGRNDADGVISDCIANIKKVHRRFGKESIIVETGFEVDETDPAVLEEGRRQLSRIIREARDRTGGHCHGVFYWEPECRPGRYRLGAFGSDGRPTVIMKAFKDWNN